MNTKKTSSKAPYGTPVKNITDLTPGGRQALKDAVLLYEAAALMSRNPPQVSVNMQDHHKRARALRLAAYDIITRTATVLEARLIEGEFIDREKASEPNRVSPPISPPPAVEAAPASEGPTPSSPAPDPSDPMLVPAP